MQRTSASLLLGTGVVMVMIVTLLALGFWQVERLQWKQKHVESVLNKDPKSFVPIEEVIVGLKRIPDVSFMKVRVRGEFYHNLSIELMPRTYHGQSGSHVYTPLVLSSSGHLLMVNRGWIPQGIEGLKYDNPQGEVELLGYLQVPTLPGWFMPDNVIQKKAWYYLDLDAMEDEVVKSLPSVKDKVLPFYLISIEHRKRDDFPKPIDVMSMVRNNHLGYAITWFGLAIALAVMYIFFLRHRRMI